MKESKCNTTPRDIMWSYGEGEWEEEGFVCNLRRSAVADAITSGHPAVITASV
ncbi:MAG: hypothetical protein PHX08_20505 [Lachnospiraceae bacterium]|nr:hypothetical protein [Lachnospiraceae bacterium]